MMMIRCRRLHSCTLCFVLHPCVWLEKHEELQMANMNYVQPLTMFAMIDLLILQTEFEFWRICTFSFNTIYSDGPRRRLTLFASFVIN